VGDAESNITMRAEHVEHCFVRSKPDNLLVSIYLSIRLDIPVAAPALGRAVAHLQHAVTARDESARRSLAHLVEERS
jgi:hypothetical protein